jgi:hypothetical protein
MAISEKAGKTYDVSEYGRLEKFIKEQDTLLNNEEAKVPLQNKKILRYAVILGGVAIVLVLFKVLIEKKK